jgi:hypothetical protein
MLEATGLFFQFGDEAKLVLIIHKKIYPNLAIVKT